MLLDNKPYTLDRTVRLAIGLVVMVGSILLLDYLSSVLLPFAIAVLLAYLINPLVMQVQKKIKNHVVSVLLSLLIVIILVGLLMWAFIPVIIKQVIYIGDLLSKLIANSNLAKQASERLPENIWNFIKDALASSNLPSLLKQEDMLRLGKDVLSQVIPGVFSVIDSTWRILIGIIGLAIILLYLVFLLLDFQRLSSDWNKMIPEKYRESIVGFVSEFNNAMKRYFRGQALVASIVGVLFAIGFTIIKLPGGIVIGLLIGVLNLVPYLQTIGLIPAFALNLLHALDTGGSFWIALLLVAIVFVVVQSIQDYFLVPKIMGKVTGLRPWLILLSLTIWGKLLGFLGLIIALPFTALLIAYYKRFILHSEGKPAMTDSIPE